MKDRNRKSPREQQLRKGAKEKLLIISIRDLQKDCKNKEDKYFHLWVLLEEQLARRARNSSKTIHEKDLLHNILEEMAILEAGEFLED